MKEFLPQVLPSVNSGLRASDVQMWCYILEKIAHKTILVTSTVTVGPSKAHGPCRMKVHATCLTSQASVVPFLVKMCCPDGFTDKISRSPYEVNVARTREAKRLTSKLLHQANLRVRSASPNTRKCLMSGESGNVSPLAKLIESLACSVPDALNLFPACVDDCPNLRSALL